MCHADERTFARGSRRGKKKLKFLQPERRLYFKLAETIGCTVSNLLNNIDSAELTEWIAYFQLVHEEEKAALERRKMEGRVRKRARRR